MVWCSVQSKEGRTSTSFMLDSPSQSLRDMVDAEDHDELDLPDLEAIFDSEFDLPELEEIMDDEVSGVDLANIDSPGLEEDIIPESRPELLKATPKVKATASSSFALVQGTELVHAPCSSSTDYIVFNETLLSDRKRKQTFPWDVGANDFATPSDFRPQLPGFGRLESSLSLVAVHSEQAIRPSSIVKRRLKSAFLASSDDHLFDLAMRKAREIVLYHPEDCGIGRALLDHAGRLAAKDEILKSLVDAVSSRAVGTAIKRIACYHSFSRWLLAHGRGRPMSPWESDVYGYLQYLISSNKGATSGSAFLKSIGFMDACFRYMDNTAATFLTGRSLGAARLMSKSKRPTKQAKTFATDHVWRMERAVAEWEMTDQERCFGGFALFCLYSSARFSDGARIKEVELERSEHVWLFKAMAFEYKGSTISERRVKALPHQALAIGLHDRCWGVKWIEARKRTGLDKMTYLMPAISHSTGNFLSRRMTSAEGLEYLQNFLLLCGLDESDARSYTMHSLKRTLLDYCSASGAFTYEERRCLGHHMSGLRSELTYSSDEMSRLQAKVFRMIYSIKQGLFDPNASGAERIRKETADLVALDPDVDDALSDSPSEDFHENLHEVLPVDPEAVEEQRADAEEQFPEVELGVFCVRHLISGIIHFVSDDEHTRLVCGRMHSHNYANVHITKEMVRYESVCKQCTDASK